MLVPELLLIGQMIDRSGMAWCIQDSFGREEMVQIAIEEWAGASPIYTRRMQRALNFEGDDVPTIFKGLQLDIGAPPQFMDFRYTIHDRWHGEFHLDHCGALLDVEPMGDEYVFGMCHTIEDPTFDATAVATNPRAQMRPIHRPPRVPADRHPHCAWTVIIDESYPEAQSIPASGHRSPNPCRDMGIGSHRPVRGGPGGLLGSVAVRSRLRRLLALGVGAHGRRGLPADASAVSIVRDRGAGTRRRRRRGRRRSDTRGLIGLAGLAAERIHRAFGLPGGIEGVLRVLELHPLLNPAGYVVAETADNRLGRAPVAGPRRRRVDFVVLAGIRAAAAGDRHRGGSAPRGSG